MSKGNLFQFEENPFKKQKGITINQVKVVTTAQTRESTWQCLSANGDNGQSVMTNLAKDIGIPEITFGLDDVLVPDDADGVAISDVCMKLTASNFAFYMLMVDDLFNAREGFDSPTDKCPDKLLALLYLNKRFEIEGHIHSFTLLEQAIDYAEDQFLGLKQTEIDGLKKGISKSFFGGRKNQISVLLRLELPRVGSRISDK